MPSMKDLLPETRTATIDLGRRVEGRARVTYKPKLISFANDFASEDENDDDRDWAAPSPLAAYVCNLITEWDFTGELGHAKTNEVLVQDGAPIPLDPVVVQHIPFPIVSGLLSGITQAEQANPTRPRKDSRRPR